MITGPPFTLKLTMTKCPDGSLFVPFAGVASACGGITELVPIWAKKHKVKVVTGPPAQPGDDPRPGFQIDDAVRLIETVQAAQEDHSDRWQRYVAYREERKREAAAKRDADMAAARATERERQKRLAKLMDERSAKEAQATVALAAARRAAREGQPAEFEDWAASA